MGARRALGRRLRLATAIAVGCAVVHNFVWHRRWTWGDRRTRGAAAVLTFLRFVGTNGLVSFAGNLVVMMLLVGGAGVNPVIANAIAIGSTGLVNFATSHLFVFDRSPSVVFDVPLQWVVVGGVEEGGGTGERVIPFARD